ncbi:3999_t:CDS:2 [Dentiscutata erythropus]|uniref:3999_t:CDS:1 n=1 Tax=Dentiscutata erythropus TaxID=1348616 RepID=A0A9N8V9Y4_9GLOM|nr:3999_t:CDS:2 [Dentiscutata erythropus]
MSENRSYALSISPNQHLFALPFLPSDKIPDAFDAQSVAYIYISTTVVSRAGYSTDTKFRGSLA